VREFYAALPKPVLVGLEATGSMFWFLRLLEELGIDRSHAWVARQQPRPGALFGLLAHRLVQLLQALVEFLTQLLQLPSPRARVPRQRQRLQFPLPGRTPQPGAASQSVAQRHRLQPVLHHHPHPHQLVPVGAGSGTGA